LNKDGYCSQGEHQIISRAKMLAQWEALPAIFLSESFEETAFVTY